VDGAGLRPWHPGGRSYVSGSAPVRVVAVSVTRRPDGVPCHSRRRRLMRPALPSHGSW
jgi:hypothetical protein